MAFQIVLVAALLVAVYGDGQCQHGGTMYCQCPFGYTGRYCETPINWCNNTHIISNNGDVTILLCGPHGTCQYDPNSGSYCICHHGWTGQFCDQPIPDNIHISPRCDFYYGYLTPNPNCTVGDRCVPDNIDCAISDAMPNCKPPVPGWCLPLGAAKSIFDAVHRYF